MFAAVIFVEIITVQFLKLSSLLIISVAISATELIFSTNAEAQQLNRRRLFRSDQPDVQQQEQAQRERLLASDANPSEDTSVIAPNVSFDQDKKKLIAKDGVIVSRESLTAQAELAEVDSEAKEAELYGDVILSLKDGSIRADSAFVQLESETGIFNNAKFTLESGQISCSAREAYKISETKYNLLNVDFTTCGCSNGEVPWSLTADSANLEEEGYASLTDVRLNLYGLPVIYSPYFAFPVKRNRATGLLVPTYGISNQDGFRYRQPLYVVTGDTSDVLLTPFIETNSRVGTFAQYRQLFSETHSLRSKWVFSNEAWRGDSLRGLANPAGTEASFDENRFGLFHSQMWQSQSSQTFDKSELGASFPTSFIADIHYVSDDTIIRELPDQDIGLITSPFTTSYVALRQGLGTYLNAELSSEYNQVIDNNIVGTDKAVFQRLPEVSLNGLRSFRPFGFNPYGVKIVTKGGLSATQFSREEGYEGRRLNISPIVQVPFRYKNILTSQFELRGFETFYNVDPDSNQSGTMFNPITRYDAVSDIDSDATVLSQSPHRRTFVGSYVISTAVEKVFDAEPEGLLGTLASLGAGNQNVLLKRTKHVMQPFLRYTYAPDVNQNHIPLFDSIDRVRRRSVVTYGLSTSLLGRFNPRVPTAYPLPEFAPEPEDLPQLGLADTYPALDFAPLGSSASGSSIVNGGVRRNGEIRRLLDLTVKQSYDLIESEENLDQFREPLSDINVIFQITPNRSFGFDIDSNYNLEKSGLSSWGGGFNLVDDRDDYFRVRYTFIDPNVNLDPTLAIPNISNLETSIEAVITDRLRLAYFSRFDETASKMLEQASALRLLSACDCWFVDFGVAEQINPNRTQINVRFTFSGLGGITQDILRRNRQQ